jgi:hypothetical protein
VSGVAAMKCQGLGSLWVGGVTAIPPGPPFVWQPLPTATNWPPAPHPLPIVRPTAPLDPPPRSRPV